MIDERWFSDIRHPVRSQTRGWTRYGRNIPVVGFVVALLVTSAYALYATSLPSVVAMNNPECLREVANNEHTTPADMFHNPENRTILHQALVTCSQPIFSS
jgi:hypothetical protein